jgi:AcrR family transcriptional regulator
MKGMADSAPSKPRFRLREERVLAVAEGLLEERGYLGLHLDEVARAVEVSRPTLYNHFSCKEDLIAGIANGYLRERRHLFHQALDFPGRSREKLCCVGVAYGILAEETPQALATLQLVRSPSIWEKVQDTRREELQENTEACFRVMLQLVERGRHAGELPEDPQVPPAALVAGLVSLSHGTFLLNRDLSFFTSAVGRPATAFLFEHYTAFLDGYRWRPLSTETNYEACRRRARLYLRPENVG